MKNLSDYEGKAIILTTQEEQIETPFYESMITEIKIQPDMFHKIWPGYYPRKELTNNIGAGMGIDFLPTVRIDNVYGDEEKYPDGRIVKKVTGLRCVKQGKRMRPDGSYQLSDPQPYEFNWIDRAELDFIADEEENKGKYKTETLKRKHILELKKFATQRAGTGAELAVIRNLTGMATSFKEDQLECGLMVVSQIVKSKDYQEAIARATVDNIRLGGGVADDINNASRMLTGNESDAQTDFNNKFQRPESTENQTRDQQQKQPAKKPDIPKVSPKEQKFIDLLTNKKLDKDARDFYLNETNGYRNTDNFDASLDWAIGEINKILEGK